MRQSWPVRPLDSDDLERVLQLNNAAVPTVNRLDAARLEDLVAQSEAALALGPVGAPLGFMLAMGPGLAYDSLNYRWFAARYDDFLYVDRIVVAEAARGRGAGRALYQAAMERAAERPLCCEVNLRPSTPPPCASTPAWVSPRWGGRRTRTGRRKWRCLCGSESDARNATCAT
ncbi:GNAT family N-acetyltransferase [Aquibaculum sediminis]|uniref:GNAT family N-acetyltransferase n=1 Tax=Aquibaculum sediminis TaxID=3231907 RepID=UPI00345586D4